MENGEHYLTHRNAILTAIITNRQKSADWTPEGVRGSLRQSLLYSQFTSGGGVIVKLALCSSVEVTQSPAGDCTTQRARRYAVISMCSNLKASWPSLSHRNEQTLTANNEQ